MKVSEMFFDNFATYHFYLINLCCYMDYFLFSYYWQYSYFKESDAALRLLAEKEVGSAPDKDEVDLHGARRVSYLDHFKPEHHFAPFTTAKMAENGDIMDKYPVPSSFAAHKRAVRPKPEHQTPSIPLPTHYTCQTKSLTLQVGIIIGCNFNYILKWKYYLIS